MARPTRVHSFDSGIYTKTEEHKVLMCSNVEGNNNKFYSLELQVNASGDEYALFSHYGRITGDTISSGILEIREGYYSKSLAEKDFNSIIKKKKNGKTITKNGKKYRESYEEIDIVSSSVGSSNVKNNTAVVKSKRQIDKDVFDSFGKTESSILKMLEEENIHEITSSTTMTYTSNGLQTPLGPLTFKHLSRAKSVLDKINSKLNTRKTDNITPGMTKLNNEYLSLIPRNLGNKIGQTSLIATGEKVLDEYDLLNQMETAIKITEMKDTDEEEAFNIGFHMELAPRSVHNEITEQIEKTRNDRLHSHVKHLKVKRVYQVENFKERKRYEEYANKLEKMKSDTKTTSNHKYDFLEVDLFHGSKNANILSILMNGIYVPPSNASHVTGRMFGNGVYGADVSTKALNYSAGFWSGRNSGSKSKSIFCFVMRFALGKVHETKRSLSTGVPSGSHSIFASGGADLQNNEYIVPKPEQTTMSYLVEFQ